MLPEESVDYFQKFVAARGRSLEGVTPAEAVELLIAFYKEQGCETCDARENEGDMLVWDFGVYDWGEGEQFVVTVARQFVVVEQLEDEGETFDVDVVSQMSMTFMDEADDSRWDLGMGQFWCTSEAEIEAWRGQIEGCGVLAAVAKRPLAQMMLEWHWLSGEEEEE